MAAADYNIRTTEVDLVRQTNPEALLDVLTIRSMRSRYSDCDVTSVASEPLISLERDLDTFVRDFTIDDSISDIFLMDEEPEKTNSKQNNTSSPGKTGKKVGRRSQSVGNILEGVDTGSTSSKKPKTFSNFFSRKSKSKADSKKTKNVKWKPQITETEVKIPFNSKGEKLAKGVYSSKANRTSKGDNLVRNEIDDNDGYMTMSKTATLGRGKVPPASVANPLIDTRNKHVPTPRTVPYIDGEYAILHTAVPESTKFDEIISHIDNEHIDNLIMDLRGISSSKSVDLRDIRGNNVLHKCVLKNKNNLIQPIISVHPTLTGHVNKEEITPAELAVKLGRLDSLKALLNGLNQLDPTSSKCQTGDLLAFAILCHQAKAISVILDHLSQMVPVTPMPHGKRGMPSHVAATHDNIYCLQRLTELGFDMTSANTEDKRPIDVARKHGADVSFQYLLVLHVLETLISQQLSCVRVKAKYEAGEEKRRSDYKMMQERVEVLHKASDQLESLRARQVRSLQHCVHLVDKMTEDKENGIDISITDLLQLRKQLSVTTTMPQATQLAHGIREMENFVKSCSPAVFPTPQPVPPTRVKEVSRTILKRVRQAGAVAELDDLVLGVLSDAINTETNGNNKTPGVSVKTSQRRYRSPRRDGDTKTRKTDKKTPAVKQTSDSVVDGYDRLWSTQATIAEKINKETTQKQHKPQTASTANKMAVPAHIDIIHGNLSPKESHEYAQIDRQNEGPPPDNTIAEKVMGGDRMVEKGRSVPVNSSVEVSKLPLAGTKSPDYATINSDIEDAKVVRDESHRIINLDDSSVFSDDDTMSTISSHNSTLQSAVGHLSRDCFSDSESDKDTITPRNVDGHLIGQLDVSDFSENSSDWWSVSKCSESCLSHVTGSQMTSQWSEGESEAYNTVRLNLENEDMPDEVLRNHRLCRHLEAVGRLTTENTDIIETVVTASGERIGSTSEDEFRSVHINTSSDTDASQKTPTFAIKSKKKSRIKLFNHGELVPTRELSQSEFLERYDRTADVTHVRRCHDDLDLPWDQLQFSDAEEMTPRNKPWYDISEDEESLAHACSSDSDASTICDSS